MGQAYLEPVDHPAAWMASDFSSLDDITLRFDQRHIDAFEDAWQAIDRAGLTLDQVEREHFEVPAIADDLADIYREIIDGRGLVLIDRLPIEDWPLTKTEIIYWGIGTHFGTGVSQSVMGDRLGHVINVGGKDPKERAYRNSMPLTLHTDGCGILGMLSIRPADEGGLSQYASALAVHNEILKARPDLLEPLYRGFRYHRFGEQGPGEEPVTPHEVPVLCQRDGVVSTRYIAGYIYMAYEELGEEIGAVEREALEFFDETAQRDDMKLEFMMPPGQLCFANNYTVLHARTGFEDRPGPDTGRMLLRLWLTAHDRRPIDPRIEIYRSQGIKKQESRENTRYDGDATDVLEQGVLRY